MRATLSAVLTLLEDPTGWNAGTNINSDYVWRHENGTEITKSWLFIPIYEVRGTVNANFCGFHGWLIARALDRMQAEKLLKEQAVELEERGKKREQESAAELLEERSRWQ